jgi:hypothetical protein
MEAHHNQDAAAAPVEKPGNNELKCKREYNDIKPGYVAINEQG